MNEKFERVHFEGEEKFVAKLYRRTYLVAGRPRSRFVALFTDWQGIRRKFKAGKDFTHAIKKLDEYNRKNDNEVDFDEQKEKRKARGMTFSKFVSQCPASMKKSPWHLPHLEEFFGSKVIAQLTDIDVTTYREKRTKEKIIKHKKESVKLVSSTTINKEISTLRKYLRFAQKSGHVSRITEFSMEVEPSRNRVLTSKEYSALLENSPAWARRVIAMAWETALSRSDLFCLTWKEIDLDEGIIELANGRAKTGRRQAMPIFTPTLADLLVELQAEHQQLPNLDGLVLTLDGQPIDTVTFEYNFRRAVKAAGIKNFKFHDLRHCAITRWAASGVPTAAAMLAAGHSSVASHKRYQNLSKSDLKMAFGVVFPSCSQEKTEKRGASIK